ncbi:MAG: sulfotransferase [Cyanobacteria bacterium J06607_10]
MSWASINDFQCLETEPIPAENLLSNPHISLYSLDFETRCAVFVETPAGLSLTDSPFYWMTQCEHAIRVITLPFADFIALASQIAVNPAKFCFIYSVGRAGSTLASRLFACVNGVEAISEPDALTTLVAARHFASVDEAIYHQNNNQSNEHSSEQMIKHLLDASVRFLCKSAMANKFVIKGRSQVTEIGDWLHELYPQAKKVFLYRNAESWLGSAKSAFTTGETREAKAQMTLEQATRAYLKPVTRLIAAYPDDQHLSTVELMILTWLSAMDACLAMCRLGIEILPIRFESWRSHPEETARKMLAYCDCYPASVSSSTSKRLLEVLSKDSQADTVLSQENIQRREQCLLPSDWEQLHYHLSRQSIICSADFNIPGTWLYHTDPKSLSSGEPSWRILG